MNAEENEGPLVATASQTVGPFFQIGLTPDGVVHAAGLPESAPRVELLVRVTDGQGEAVRDAMVEIWYVAERVHHKPESSGPLCTFARRPTAPVGTCTFEIVRPQGTSPAAEETVAPHVNVCVFARGLLRQLHTRIYFEGDPLLDHDAVLGHVPMERRPTLLARRDEAQQDRWLFDLRLQGIDETVFFDL